MVLVLSLFQLKKRSVARFFFPAKKKNSFHFYLPRFFFLEESRGSNPYVNSSHDKRNRIRKGFFSLTSFFFYFNFPSKIFFFFLLFP